MTICCSTWVRSSVCGNQSVSLADSRHSPEMKKETSFCLRNAHLQRQPPQIGLERSFGYILVGFMPLCPNMCGAAVCCQNDTTGLRSVYVCASLIKLVYSYTCALPTIPGHCPSTASPRKKTHLQSPRDTRALTGAPPNPATLRLGRHELSLLQGCLRQHFGPQACV